MAFAGCARGRRIIQMSLLRETIKLGAKQLKRMPMQLLLHNLVTWRPQGEPEPGYTIVVACVRDLAPLATANLQLCARCDASHRHEIILVFDCPAHDIPDEVRVAARDVAPSVQVRLFGYSDRQHRIARMIDWGWVYSWLSWCRALSEARTRAVIIHDLDALPLDPGLFEQLYAKWSESQAEFCGISPYVGDRITEEMNLVRTPELTFDVAYVRQRFRPFDIFNKLRLIDGRAVDFDTMLHVQWRSPRRVVRPIDETQLVHPSQLICQYTDLVAGRSDFRRSDHSLPMLPYFFHLGGDPTKLEALGPLLADECATCVKFCGRTLRIDGLRPARWAWMEKQIRRMEQSFHGGTRPEVEDYLAGFIRRAGGERTVGIEVGPASIASA
jgi:hypothetical protein